MAFIGLINLIIPVNTEAHIKTTAEEIWNQTNGKIDAFTCAVGTGGTLSRCFNRFKR